MIEHFKQHGAFSWCELMTTDTEAAKAFYSKLFGWVMNDLPMEGTTYTTLKAGEQEIGGMMSTSASGVGNPPPHWGVYFTVKNVDETSALASEMGAKILMQPTDIPDVGRFAVFQDPQGAILSIISYNH